MQIEDCTSTSLDFRTYEMLYFSALTVTSPASVSMLKQKQHFDPPDLTNTQQPQESKRIFDSVV